MDQGTVKIVDMFLQLRFDCMIDNMISMKGISNNLEIISLARRDQEGKTKVNNILYIGNEDTRRETLGFCSCGG